MIEKAHTDDTQTSTLFGDPVMQATHHAPHTRMLSPTRSAADDANLQALRRRLTVLVERNFDVSDTAPSAARLTEINTAANQVTSRANGDSQAMATLSQIYQSGQYRFMSDFEIKPSDQDREAFSERDREVEIVLGPDVIDRNEPDDERKQCAEYWLDPDNVDGVMRALEDVELWRDRAGR